MNGSLNGRTFKIVTGAGSALIALVGAVLFIDDRYAHAGDVKAMHEVQLQAVRELRKENLEDKVFELSLIPAAKRTDAQRAMLDRYKRQLQEIESRQATNKQGRN